MDNTYRTNQQLQQANRQLDETIESATGLMNAGTILIWAFIIIIVAGFVAGICKALFNKEQPSNDKKLHNAERDDNQGTQDKCPTIGGKIALGVVFAILAGIFALVAYVIIKYV